MRQKGLEKPPRLRNQLAEWRFCDSSGNEKNSGMTKKFKMQFINQTHGKNTVSKVKM